MGTVTVPKHAVKSANYEFLNLQRERKSENK